MNVEDLALLMGKTRKEIEEMLKSNDIIELNLKERKQIQERDIGKIEIIK
jgi:hypothetical protein